MAWDAAPQPRLATAVQSLRSAVGATLVRLRLDNGVNDLPRVTRAFARNNGAPTHATSKVGAVSTRRLALAVSWAPATRANGIQPVSSWPAEEGWAHFSRQPRCGSPQTRAFPGGSCLPPRNNRQGCGGGGRRTSCACQLTSPLCPICCTRASCSAFARFVVWRKAGWWRSRHPLLRLISLLSLFLLPPSS